MTKIDRNLFWEVALLFLGAQAILVVVFLGTEALTEVSKLIGRFGLPWGGALKMLGLRMPWALAWTLPMSVAMAVILTVARLCKDHEYVAIIVGGMSFRRLMVPMLFFATLVTAGALWLQEYAGPAMMMAYHVNKQTLIAKARADLIDFNLRLSDHASPQRIMLDAERLDSRAKELHGLALTVSEASRQRYRVWARFAKWDETTGQWVLHDGTYSVWREGEPPTEGTFTRSTVRDLAAVAGYNGTFAFESSPNEISIYGTDKSDYLTGPQIRQRLDWMADQHFERKEINRVYLYLQRRYTLGTSCFLFVLIGAPLAVKPQRGASMGGSFAVALALILTYYIIWQATGYLGEGARYPFLWGWAANFAGLLVGLRMWRDVPD